MDGKTFLLTLVFGHDGVGNLLRHTGKGPHHGHCRSRGADRLAPQRGPIMAIAVAGGRIAWLLQKDKEDPDPPARE